jgi:hypothetical protein
MCLAAFPFNIVYGGSKAGVEAVAQGNILDPDGIESRPFMLYPVTSQTQLVARKKCRR